MLKEIKKGFTLAEVLIVIGIIGVVAALTLPNLNHATGDKERVTKVKKIYSALNEAFDRAQAIYGDYDTWYNDLDSSDLTTKNQRFGKRITEFMKISKDCEQELPNSCFANAEIKTISGSGTVNLSERGMGGPSVDYRVITSDNMSILFHFGGNIVVDIDGPSKGANTKGKDLFYFAINSDSNSIVPDKTLNNTLAYKTFVDGDLGALWIIENDNADYLKADSTGKCNDSDIVLDWETNTSCH